MNKISYITPKTITKDEVRELRKTLGLTQRQFAEFINVSVPTVERWESGDKEISGPITLLREVLLKHPEILEELVVPDRQGRLRLWYMYKDRVCTLIDVDELGRKVYIKNYTENPIFCAFGNMRKPSYEAYESFLESRCFPRGRDKMKLMLQKLDIPFYDPMMIIEKTQGRMAEDDFWIRIER